ncbi:MAG: hypothetical protein A2Z14_17980 [Chloroflexi bacterium RBG_16_48_8]|nr:MAG: hypothetical protein A2Z14_17980 [Chloroflexi bacterium RBG_16_48_8]
MMLSGKWLNKKWLVLMFLLSVLVGTYAVGASSIQDQRGEYFAMDLQGSQPNSLSPFAAQACNADLNADGRTDATDLDWMVNAVLLDNPENLCVDLNTDGHLNVLDLQFLINLILNPPTGNTYYVSTSGSDSNDGSMERPWGSIMHAVRNSGAGDTVYVRGGTYSESEMWIRGSLGHGGEPGGMWTLAAYPGETVELTGRIVIEASWVRVSGFSMTGSSGIAVRPGSGVRPTNVEILNNRVTGTGYRYEAISYRGDNGLIEGNFIEVNQSNTTDHGIYLHAGANNVVRNNYIKKAHGYGIHVYDEDKGYDYVHHYENVLIENNTVNHTETRAGIVLGNGPEISFDGVVIRNNVLVNNGTNGIQIQNYGGTFIRNVQIYNNTIYASHYALTISAESGGSISNITAKNNIFAASDSSHIDSSGVTNVLLDHNLYWQPQSVGTGVSDDHPVYGDPLFLDASSGDFHLPPGSPACGAGEAGVDIGAYACQ